MTLAQRHPQKARPSLLLPAALGCLVALVGCAGYQVGNWSLYPADIKTVHVPMFQSASFRRNLAEWLTEAVVKEIELKTPYKVVGSPSADSILSGRLAGEGADLVVENRFDDPRAMEVDLVVEVRWMDRRSNQLSQGVVPLPPELVSVKGTGRLVPEVGHSVATAELEAIQDVAQRIVGMMEAPW